MNNITLISTEHRESGHCNSTELLRIVERISPQVIFEENPNDQHYQSYYNNENSFNSLEVQTIKKYKISHNLIHIPVDKPINEYVSLQVLDMLSSKYREYQDYNKLIKEHCFLRDQYGFEYLNHNRCKVLVKIMNNFEKQIIAQNDLHYFYNLFQGELELRENAMLENIYNYCIESEFEQAILFLGFMHRESFEKKILKYNSKEELNLKWTYYKGNDNSTGS